MPAVLIIACRRLADAKAELNHRLLAVGGDLADFKTCYRFGAGEDLATISRLSFLH
jgi:hypothetical protein